MAADIVISIASKIGEYLVGPTMRQLNYLLCLNHIVDDLKKEKERLMLVQDKVQNTVNGAIRNAQEIEEDVQKWLKDAKEVIEDVHNLESEMKSNKGCFKGWCPDWGWRYKLGKVGTKKKKVVVKIRKDGNFNGVSHPAPPPGIDIMSSGDFMAFQSTMLVFDRVMKALNDESCNIIGVYGMGGIGKTTLVTEVGNRAKQLRLFDEVVMAVVSKDKDDEIIQGQLADMLGLQLNAASQIGRAGQLHARLKNKEKTLIILDDVWVGLNLAAIGIPYGVDHKGCKIVVTTRRLQVCNSMESQMNIPLNVLSEEEAWQLFKKKARIGDRSPQILKTLEMEVARECHGLPIAIITLGSALRGKELHFWKSAAGQLKKSKANNIGDMDENVNKCLQLSYDYLKDEETKTFFLLCCLFPEDYDISIEDLARYGMGQGIFQDVETLEEARSRLLIIINNLIDSSLLLQSKSEHHIKMHDVVRDFAIQVTNQGKHVFIVRAGMGLKEWPKMERYEDCTAISLIDNKINELKGGFRCPRLEALLLCQNGISNQAADAFFDEMKSLKILDLSKAKKETLPNIRQRYLLFKRKEKEEIFSLPTSLGRLTNLRTLCLDYRVLSDISIVGTLKKLEILSLFNCRIKEFPKDIGELNNLRLLDLTFCRSQRKIPANVISRLSNLEELYLAGTEFGNLSQSTKEIDFFVLSELNSLPYLTAFSMSSANVNNIPKDFRFPNLLRYEITSHVRIYYKFPYSKSLELEFYDLSIPDAIKELLMGAEEIIFNLLSGRRNIIPDICHTGLKELKSLVIRVGGEMECLIDTTQSNASEAFQNLDILGLHNMNHMIVMCRGILPTGFLRRLSVLELSQCNKFRHIFPHAIARKLEQLKSILIYECEGLEQIMSMDDDEEDNLSEPQLQLAGFSNLQTIKIHDCSNLKSLFPVNVARVLVQLKYFIVVGCSQLKEVFSDNDRNVRDEKNEIVFPQLRELNLEGLPSLVSFYPENHHFILPSLHHLLVQRCPILRTSFTTAPDGIVHAKGKGLKLVEEAVRTGASEIRPDTYLDPYTCDLIWNRAENSRRTTSLCGRVINHDLLF